MTVIEEPITKALPPFRQLHDKLGFRAVIVFSR